MFINEGFRLVLQISMASTKRIYTNSNYTAWNCNAYKSITIEEGAISNPCYTIWNVDVFKRITIEEGAISNPCYTIWNVDTCKGFTTKVFTTDYYSIFYR